MGEEQLLHGLLASEGYHISEDRVGMALKLLTQSIIYQDVMQLLDY